MKKATINDRMFRYLDGTLSEAQVKQLNRDLQKNPALLDIAAEIVLLDIQLMELTAETRTRQQLPTVSKGASKNSKPQKPL